MAIGLQNEFRALLKDMRQREGFTKHRYDEKRRDGRHIINTLLSKEQITFLASLSELSPDAFLLHYIRDSSSNLSEEIKTVVQSTLNFDGTNGALLGERRSLTRRKLRTMKVPELFGHRIPEKDSTYAVNIEEKALVHFAEHLDNPDASFLKEILRQPEQAVDRFCTSRQEERLAANTRFSVAADQLAKSIYRMSSSKLSFEMERFFEALNLTQFSHPVIRRNWDIQIKYNICDINNGIVVEILDWEYELINITGNDIEYEITLTHSSDDNMGNISTIYTISPDGSRNQLSFSDHTKYSGHHYKQEAAKIKMLPDVSYYVSLHYRNVWYVNSRKPVILNATTSKQPCLNCRIRFEIPETMKVSIINRVIIEPHLVDGVLDVRLPQPLLAEQKIEYVLEPNDE